MTDTLINSRLFVAVKLSNIRLIDNINLMKNIIINILKITIPLLLGLYVGWYFGINFLNPKEINSVFLLGLIISF